MTIENVYQWMLVNVSQLVAAIEKDGAMDGPTSAPLLHEAQNYDSSGTYKTQARSLLRKHLELRRLGHLLP